MRAAAELAREALDLHDTDDVAVLLTKQHHGTELACLVLRGLEREDAMPLDDDAVDDVLDARQFLGRQRGLVREVEAQLVGAHGGALLAHVIAEHLLQRAVQHVRAGVVGLRRAAARRVDDRAHLLIVHQLAVLHDDDQRLILVEANHVDDRGTARVGLDMAGVGDLAATLGIERRLAQLHGDAPIADVGEGADARADVVLVVADELGHEPGLACERGHAVHVDAATLAGGAAGALALRLHQLGKASLINREILFGDELLRQLEREAVRVVQQESVGGGQRGATLSAHARDALLQLVRAGLEGAQEALFLATEDADDVIAVLDELGIDIAELRDHKIGEALEERALNAEAMAVRDGATDDAAQDVATRLVGGQHTVGGEERHRAAVVGEDAQRLRVDAAGLVRRAGPVLDGGDDRLEAVGLVDGVHALLECGDALDARTRVDARLGERRQRAVLGLVVLHEHEVPELEEAIAVAAGLAAVRAGGAATAVLGPAVVVELAARAARSGRTGLPEVVLAAEADDALGGHALGKPELARLVVAGHLVVAGEDRDPHLVGVHLPRATDERPRELDGAGLEVVAKREVAHHLEEGEMARGLTDLVDVRRAEALLHARQARARRCVEAEEERLERLHACGCQQDRRIERRGHEARRGHDEMPVLLEVVPIGGADFVSQHCPGRVRDAPRPGFRFALVPGTKAKSRTFEATSGDFDFALVPGTKAKLNPHRQPATTPAATMQSPS